VYVARIRAEAEVLDAMPDGTVRVQAGPLKLTLDPGELRASVAAKATDEAGKRRATKAGGPVTPAAPSMPGREPAGLETPLQTADNTCDLRGLRADDAVSLAVTFLDRSLNENRRTCFLLHGHGTGALKEAIRRELKASPYVRFYRAGLPGEGGDGVTVAWLS
jgi:DNA mismatch repair protein MutS2